MLVQYRFTAALKISIAISPQSIIKRHQWLFTVNVRHKMACELPYYTDGCLCCTGARVL